MQKNIRITDEFKDALNLGVWGDDGLFRIKAKLDRKIYEGANAVLVALGGKWNKGKKGHIFDNDEARERLDDVMNTGICIDWKKTNEFFETPPETAEFILDLAGVHEDTYMLEPSAGKGAIVLEALKRGACVTAIEKHEPYAKEIIKHNSEDEDLIGGCTVQIADFLKYSAMGIYDAIVMNPPFRSEIEHITHAYSFLKEDGILVSITSPSWRFRTTRKARMFREWLDSIQGPAIPYEWYPLPEGTFKVSGTGVNTGILTIRKGD